MVCFLGVASLLLFSYTALVAADAMEPRISSVERNDVGAGVLGRRAGSCPANNCEHYDIQLNQLTYLPYAQRSAMMASAAGQAPSVATKELAVDVSLLQ